MILLMFGVGLHFHLKDLLAVVRRVAIPGALVQIAVATGLGRLIYAFLRLDMDKRPNLRRGDLGGEHRRAHRVLADNGASTPQRAHRHWLAHRLRDLFTILVLVLLAGHLLALPTLMEISGSHWECGVQTFGARRLRPPCRSEDHSVVSRLCLARTGSRELFTLAILVLALGIAVGSVKFLGPPWRSVPSLPA